MGNPEYLLVVGMDITERQQVENALYQINAKLNVVSSIARHDILNKLTIIYGIISLLKESITDPAPGIPETIRSCGRCYYTSDRIYP